MVNSPDPTGHSSVPVPKEQTRALALDAGTLNSAVELFGRFGFLLIEKALNADLVGRLQQAFLSQYAAKDRSELERDNLRVGHERFQMTVDIAPPFDAPDIYANPVVLPILVRLLGPGLVLNSFGSVCAFPGSKAQHVHLDHPLLFEAVDVNRSMPPYAVTVVIPLVDIDDTVGPTAVWPGSHREGQARVFPDHLALAPKPRMGDVFLMDYRLVHGGRANSSTRPRPILYLVYSRPWFRDAANFGKQRPILMSREALARVADAHKPLFRCHVAP